MSLERGAGGTGWTPLQALADDVLFFRDGKPNTVGSDHYLRSLFPPYPPTLYGALRTRRLFDAGVPLDRLEPAAWADLLGSLVSELGPWGGFGSLAVRGPWIVRAHEGEEQVLLPAPADLVLLLGKSDATPERRGAPSLPQATRVFRLREVETRSSRWSHRLALLAPHEWTDSGWRRWLAPPEPEPTSAAGWYLTPRGFQSWSEGGVPEPGDLVPREALWVDEVRVGLGLTANDRTAQDHMLYTFGYVRLRQGVAIGFEVTGTGLAAEGSLRLGGDGRTARLGPGPAFPIAPPVDRSLGKRFRVVLATPSLSASGGYPPGFGPARLDGGPALPCRLVAAAVPTFGLAGGWDIALERAKPLRRVLPAGSVFLFESLEVGGAAELAARLHGGPLVDFPGAGLGRQGFGLAVVGAETQEVQGG